MRASRLALVVAALVVWTSAGWRPPAASSDARAGDLQVLAVRGPATAPHVRSHAPHDPPPLSSVWGAPPAAVAPSVHRAVALADLAIAVRAPHVRIARSPCAARAPPIETT